MSGKQLVLDTNILIYLLNGDEDLYTLIADVHCFISFVTEIEILSFRDLSQAQIFKIKQFLSYCTIIEMNSTIKELTINYRRLQNLKTPDAIICATATYLNLTLVTADKKLNKLETPKILQYNLSV